MDNKLSRSTNTFTNDNRNQELRRNIIVENSLRNSCGLLKNLCANSDALEAVKLDPAVLEAQVTMPTNNNVKNEKSALENRKVNQAKVSPSGSRKIYKEMLSQNEQAVLSLTPDELSLLLQYTDMLRRQRTDIQKSLECGFCKNSGRLPYKYTPHMLKDDTGRVTCPILRRYRCPRCGATGDEAHTLKYCPHTLLLDTQSI